MNRKIIAYVLVLAACCYYWFNRLFIEDYFYFFPDLVSYFFFRESFFDSLWKGNFPQWNPYNAFGHIALSFSHVPINQYSLFNIFFGVTKQSEFVFRILDFLMIQAAVIILCNYLKYPVFYGFLGALFYFQLSYVKYYYWCPFINNVYISIPLILLFSIKLFRENQPKKFVIALILVLNFSLLGTRVDYWFLTIMWFLFLYSIVWWMYREKMTVYTAIIYNIIILGSVVLCNLWQICPVHYYLAQSSRFSTKILVRILDFHWIREFVLSFYYSGMIKETVLMCLIYTAFRLLSLNKIIIIRTLPMVICLGIVLLIMTSPPHNTTLPLFTGNLINLMNFLAFKLFIIILISYFLFNLLLLKEKKVYDVKHVFIICLLFNVISYCYFGEDWFDRDFFNLNGSLFKNIFLVLFMLGILDFHKSKVVKVCVFSILSIYFMRNHGQIILLDIFQMAWFVQRDNQYIDLCAAIIAVHGLRNVISYSLITNDKIFTFTTWNSIHKNTKAKRYSGIIIIGILLSGVVLIAVVNMKQVILPTNPSFSIIKQNAMVHFYNRKLLIERILELETGKNKLPFRIVIDRKSPLLNQWVMPYNMLQPHLSEVNYLDSIVPDEYLYFMKKDYHVQTPVYIHFPKSVMKAKGFVYEELAKTYVDYLEKDVEYPFNANQIKLANMKYYITETVPDKVTRDNPGLLFEYRGSLGLKHLDNIPITVHIYEYMDYMPRFSFVNDFQVIEGKDTLIKTLFDKEFDVSKQVLFGDRYNNNALKLQDSNGKKLHYTIRVLSYNPESVQLDIESNQDAFLVFTDQWDKSWRVWINGEEKEILNCDIAFRALKIKKGNTSVLFKFNLKYFNTSLVISLISWGLLIACALKKKQYSTP